MGDRPSTEDLERRQREREAAEREASAVVDDEREQAIHARRADKARYLRERLAERVQSEEE